MATPFKGPVRGDYTPEQFAEAYEVDVNRVRDWIRKGFVVAARTGRIRERDRQRMERHYGEPAHPRSVLP